MINVYFGDDDYKTKIGEFSTLKDAYKGGIKYVKENFHQNIYYTRISGMEESGENIIWIDYGSYTKFIYISGFSDDDLSEWLNESK